MNLTFLCLMGFFLQCSQGSNQQNRKISKNIKRQIKLYSHNYVDETCQNCLSTMFETPILISEFCDKGHFIGEINDENEVSFICSIILKSKRIKPEIYVLYPFHELVIDVLASGGHSMAKISISNIGYSKTGTTQFWMNGFYYETSIDLIGFLKRYSNIDDFTDYRHVTKAVFL